jgi:hypothetical protein
VTQQQHAVRQQQRQPLFDLHEMWVDHDCCVSLQVACGKKYNATVLALCNNCAGANRYLLMTHGWDSNRSPGTG